MHIVVTGGAGFIGSHVVEALITRGDSVHVIDNLSTGKRENLPANVSLTVGDIADTQLMQKLAASADAIIHLAAIASVPACEADWVNAHRTNAFGTVSVLNAAATSSKKPCVIYASSAAVYGENNDLPLKETYLPAPISVYGMDKFVSECEAAIAYKRFGINSVGLRFFNVYGPRQDPSSPYSGVISIFARAAQENTGITIYGDGGQTRDFIFVSDIVALILASMQAPEGAHIVNGCTAIATSLNQLAQHLRDISGCVLSPSYHPARVADIRASLGDNSLAATLLHTRPSVPIRDGLALLLTSLTK